MSETALSTLINRCEWLVSIPLNDRANMDLCAIAISDILTAAKSENEHRSRSYVLEKEGDRLIAEAVDEFNI